MLYDNRCKIVFITQLKMQTENDLFESEIQHNQETCLKHPILVVHE